MAKLIDANVILRNLLEDIPEQAEMARFVIAGGAFTTTEVLAEVVYVLEKVYSVPRGEIREAVAAVIGEVSTDHPEVILKALSIYAERKLDFVDCILIARVCVLGDEVFSFDKKLNNAIKAQLES